MALFDLLEFITLGTAGLTVALVVVNALNLLLNWASWLIAATGSIVVIGVLTHGWRFSSESGHLKRAAPRMAKALKSVRREVVRCNRREAACLASLKNPEGEPVEDDYFREAASVRQSSPTRRRHVGSKSTPTIAPRSDTRPPVGERAYENVTLSDDELHVVKYLRDLEHGRVGRGRPTCGRGVCPVPGNIAGEPAYSAVYQAPRPYPLSRQAPEYSDE